MIIYKLGYHYQICIDHFICILCFHCFLCSLYLPYLLYLIYLLLQLYLLNLFYLISLIYLFLWKYNWYAFWRGLGEYLLSFAMPLMDLRDLEIIHSIHCYLLASPKFRLYSKTYYPTIWMLKTFCLDFTFFGRKLDEGFDKFL